MRKLAFFACFAASTTLSAFTINADLATTKLPVENPPAQREVVVYAQPKVGGIEVETEWTETYYDRHVFDRKEVYDLTYRGAEAIEKMARVRRYALADGTGPQFVCVKTHVPESHIAGPADFPVETLGQAATIAFERTLRAVRALILDHLSKLKLLPNESVVTEITGHLAKWYGTVMDLSDVEEIVLAHPEDYFNFGILEGVKCGTDYKAVYRTQILGITDQTPPGPADKRTVGY